MSVLGSCDTEISAVMMTEMPLPYRHKGPSGSFMAPPTPAPQALPLLFYPLAFGKILFQSILRKATTVQWCQEMWDGLGSRDAITPTAYWATA